MARKIKQKRKDQDKKRIEKGKAKGLQKPLVKKTKGFKLSKFKLFLLFAIILSFIASSVWLFWGTPLPTDLDRKEFPVSTKLFDRNGGLLYEIYADERRDPLDVKTLPPYVIEATIAIEDKDFYKHHGIDIQGITRALFNTLFKKRLQGGSTLTQQLVKTVLLTPERTVKRKIKELVLTFIVEARYSKEEILNLYLNQIPYGSTAYGIGAASELYFGKEAKDLTLPEASLLAGITAAPTRFSPFGAHPELAKERQEAVLRRMVEDKYITEEEADTAKNEELHFAKPEDLKAPHFSLWVKDVLAEEYGDATVEKGGLRVTTTLDLDLQKLAEDAVASEVAKLQKSNVGNGAALVTKPGTGEILAMVGSKDYFAEDEDGKVNIIFRERQPGSSIKPLNYALGLKDKKITLATPFADVPTCFSVLGQKDYCPVNYDGTYHGATQIRFAMANSYNIPAVRVLALNGVDNFIDFAEKLGITTWNDRSKYGLSLTLGGGEVRPFDMATAFGVFANQGVKIPLQPILKVEDWKGNVLKDIDPQSVEGDRILDPEVPFLISHALSDNGARSSAFGSSSQLVVKGHPEVAVKTGTTNDLKDNWTVGYTNKVLVVTWVGNNDSTPMSRAVSGVSGASPIWNQIIKFALDKANEGNYGYEKSGSSKLAAPEGVIGANVCNVTGNLPDNPDSPGCTTRFEYFLKDALGARINAGSMDVSLDRTTGALAAPGLPPELIETQHRPFLSDPLGTIVCLDCTVASSSAKIGYPLKNR